MDADGRPTTDAEAAKRGAIAPFGGPKGYGLGLAFELLVVALAGSAIGRDVVGTLDAELPCNKGVVFIVLEPATGAARMIGSFMEDLRASAPVDVQQPVRVPGDRAAETRARNLQAEIKLAAGVWAQIEDMANAGPRAGEGKDFGGTANAL